MEGNGFSYSNGSSLGERDNSVETFDANKYGDTNSNYRSGVLYELFLKTNILSHERIMSTKTYI